MQEVRIKTNFGEIVISYSNLSELENGLKEVDKVIEIVTTKIGTIKETPKVKTGFDDIYRINDDGSVSILKPGGKTEHVGIVMFAYDPTPLKVEFIAQSSGVRNAKDFLKGKYFDRLEYGFYKLNSTGLNWIINEVVEKLRKSKNTGG